MRGMRTVTAWALGAGLVLGALHMIAPTAAALSQATSNGPSAFSSAADWTAPSLDGSTIAKTTGGTPGYVRAGGTYYVYASVTDTGNPASGVASATANVIALTTSASNTPLSAGSFTVGGIAYGRRSGSLTVATGLAEGTYSFSIGTADQASNSTTYPGQVVTVDNTAPAATDIQATNRGPTVGRPEASDQITFTHSEQIDPAVVIAGWTGASTSVVVRITDGGGGNDSLTIWNAANSAQLFLGSVNLGRKDYVTANTTFGASGTTSTMVQSGANIVVTFGTAAGTVATAAGTGSMVLTPSATATDRAGNAVSTTTRTETGTADKEF